MLCKLKNKNRVLWQDVRELVSLVELCNALGFELQQNYTPLPFYKMAFGCVMVQVVHESDAEDLVFSLKSLLRIIPLIESCQVIDQHEYSSVYKNNNVRINKNIILILVFEINYSFYHRLPLIFHYHARARACMYMHWVGTSACVCVCVSQQPYTHTHTTHQRLPLIFHFHMCVCVCVCVCVCIG